MTPPDIVYPVRKGNYNDELRYSLRSLQNLPHGKVILAGYIPNWVTGVTAVNREQKGNNWLNARENIAAALSEASDPFYLFNDDFYVMEPMDEVPIYHAGLLSEVIDRYRRNRHTGAYWRGMQSTYLLLQEFGFSEPLGYELHMPLLIQHAPFLKALEMGSGIEALAWRTLYGNLADLGGTQVTDCKVYAYGAMDDLDMYPFLSSSDDLPYSPLGKVLNLLYTEHCSYESD